jgi:hypothetical protein
MALSSKSTDPKPEAANTPAPKPEKDVDRVVAVSFRADGTPDQSPGYVVMGEEDKKS